MKNILMLTTALVLSMGIPTATYAGKSENPAAGAGKSDENKNQVSGSGGNQGNDKDKGNAGGNRDNGSDSNGGNSDGSDDSNGSDSNGGNSGRDDNGSDSNGGNSGQDNNDDDDNGSGTNGGNSGQDNDDDVAERPVDRPQPPNSPNEVKNNGSSENALMPWVGQCFTDGDDVWVYNFKGKIFNVKHPESASKLLYEDCVILLKGMGWLDEDGVRVK